MALLGEVYAFPRTAPTHDEVSRLLCSVLGRDVLKSEFRAPPRPDPRPERREAEKRGSFLFGETTTTFHENEQPRSRYVNVITLRRGDKIYVSGNCQLLFEAIGGVMGQLGGKAEPPRNKTLWEEICNPRY